MWVFAILLIITSVLVHGLHGRLVDADRMVRAEASTVAQTMAMYRTAALNHATAHPGVDVATCAALNGPGVLASLNPALGCIVQHGVVAVFLDKPGSAAVVDAIDRLSQHSIMVGVTHRDSASGIGTLFSPASADTGIVVPAAVPDGAPTWIAGTAGVAP